MDTLSLKKPRGYWKDSNNIIEEIKTLHSKGIELNPKSIDKYNSSLRTVARKAFGSWEQAIVLAGLDYEKIKKTKLRDKKGVINDILYRYKNGMSINQTALMNDDCALFSACVSQFGSFANAIEACGLEYKSIKKIESWTKERVVAELKNRYDSNLSMSVSNVQKEAPLLYGAIFRYFDHYNLAIEELGIDYNTVRKIKHWTTKEIIEALQLRHKYNLPLNSTALEKENESLYTACRNRFGTYKKAIEATGLDYNEIREDIGSINYYGYEFEELVGEVFTELHLQFTKKFNREYQPDFVFSNERWLDAKLSEWTIYKYATIEKYEPVCKMLTIVFLRGDKRKDEMITNKTRLISVYQFIKQLPKERRQQYIGKVNDLLNRINESEH